MKTKIHALWYPGGLSGAAVSHAIAHSFRQNNVAERDGDDMFPICGAPASRCKADAQRGSAPADSPAWRKDETVGSDRQSPRRNRILDALPEQDYLRLLPALEPVNMPLGWVAYESGAPLRYLYFPTTSIVSLLYVTQSGASAEFAITGNEGVVGVPLLMGGESTPGRAVVQCAGEGYRLNACAARKEFALAGNLHQIALRYTQALITQMAQTAVCNRHHTLDQQLCRWLLVTLDRLSGNELQVTQEMIANMLGVRREGVTEAAGKLQAEGLIHTRRGHIQVLDRAGLGKRACECYAVVKREYDRLLPGTSSVRQIQSEPCCEIEN